MVGDHGNAAFAAEVHIGLVHNDHPVRIGFQQPPDVRAGDGHAGGGVGVGNDDGAGKVHVVVHAQGEVLPQRDHLGLQTEQRHLRLVEAVGDVGVGQRLAFAAESTE